ncbi:MAG: DNA-directed RNA polymerase subunit omega [Opitutaceae bacterium]|nr:DNA-directed RNA polymerase subunit omega [Cytophagales bacterium]
MKQLANASIVTRDVIDLAHETKNVYESIAIISKRARQVSTKMKEELSQKLSEFATKEDNLEEIFENREQIEISKYYERMPKPSMMALEEFIEGKVYFRKPDEEVL